MESLGFLCIVALRHARNLGTTHRKMWEFPKFAPKKCCSSQEFRSLKKAANPRVPVYHALMATHARERGERIRGRHGGVEKRGGWKTSRMTPLPKKGFGPPSYGFPPPSGVVALFFLYKNPRQSRPEALLEGSRISREGAFSGTFSSPHTFCTPPYHGPREREREKEREREREREKKKKREREKERKREREKERKREREKEKERNKERKRERKQLRKKRER